MPPKKAAGGKGKGGKGKKGKKGKKEEVVAVVEEPQIAFSDDSLAARDIDLLADINDEFFATADKIIQNLSMATRLYEASKIRKYVNIIYNMHRRYADEVKLTSELRPQVERADYKLRIALELTGTSQEAMDRIKDALSDAWKEADASQMREQDIQEKLQQLVIKCESFESKESDKHDDSAEFGALAKYKNIILRERDRLEGEVTDLEKRLHFQRFYSESLEYINKNFEESINKQGARYLALEMEKSHLDVKIRSLTSNLDDQRDNNMRALAKLDHVQKELEETKVKFQKKIADYDRQKLVLDRFKGDNIAVNRQLHKIEEEIKELRRNYKSGEEQIRALKLEDKVKGNTISQMAKRYKKAIQDTNSMSSKLYKCNKQNLSLNEDIIRLKNQINSLEKDVQNWIHKYDEERRLKENFIRDRDTLRSDILKLNNTIADLRHTIMIHSNANDALRLDNAKLNGKLDEAKINVNKAEKERDEMQQEVENLQERIETFQEQVQFKTDLVTDLQEKLTQKHFVLFNVKKQLESVHSDKMMLQRALEACTQERDNFRILQTKTTHQSAQFTAEILANQNKINSLNMRIERLNTDKKDLQSELLVKENMLNNVRNDLKEMTNKNHTYMKTIEDDEHKLMKISHDLDETRKEKNLVGLQMVRRNDEIVLLKEKLQIMQTAVDQGQSQYNLRVEDIRLLKMEIVNLETERNILTRAIKSTADMREEIVRLQRCLIQERVKVRSLTEDSKTPTGVHRWRILRGEDPNKFQLLAKVQMLQRRNLKQQVDMTNLERQLEEARKVAASFKKVVENLPTSDVKQKLVVTQRINRAQQKKLKALNAELAIDEIELKARECIIEEFKTSLKLTKQQLCHEVPSVSSSELMPFTVYSSRENYMDCVFMSSNPSQDNSLKAGQSI